MKIMVALLQHHAIYTAILSGLTFPDLKKLGTYLVIGVYMKATLSLDCFVKTVMYITLLNQYFFNILSVIFVWFRFMS